MWRDVLVGSVPPNRYPVFNMSNVAYEMGIASKPIFAFGQAVFRPFDLD